MNVGEGAYRSLVAVACATVCTWLGVAAILALASREPLLPIDAPGFADHAFGRVRDLVPTHGVVGYVLSTNDPVEGPRQYFLAQYALVPRVLTEDLSLVEWAVAGPGAPPTLDDDPRLVGFGLVDGRLNGLRLYRRTGR